MAYTINRTDGTLFATVADGTIDTTSSLIMIGKNYAGYGEALNENFFRLLESHSNATAPVTPQQGQLWYDSSTGIIKVWNNTEWKDLGASIAGAAGPTSPIIGDMWFDTTNSQLNVWNGIAYVLIGPAFSSGTGTTGILVETVSDGALDHVIIKVVVSDGVVAIISKDATFTPDPLITNFTTISPGYNLADIVDGNVPQFVGDATNAIQLNGVDSTGYLSAIANDSTTGTIDILNDSGLTVGVGAVPGTDGQLTISIDPSEDVIIQNVGANHDLLLGVSVAGSPTTAITINGVTGKAEVGLPGNGVEIANQDYVDSVTTGAYIKSTYEGELDTNAFDDAAVTKLAGVETGATNNETYTTEAGNLAIIDLDANQTLASTLTGNVSLTTSNRAAGLKVDVFYDASVADRTVTLNAFWHSYGVASPIIIPTGKRLVLTLTCLGTAETDVHVAAVLEN